MRIAALALVGAVAVTVVLAGCAPAARPTATPTPKATPVFASDAAALKAAEAAYSAYQKVSDSVAAGGGNNPKPLRVLVTSDWYSNEVRSSQELRSSGLHQVGASAHTSLKLQQVNSTRTRLTAYTCIDLSDVRYVDASDNEKTPARSSEVPVVVDFVASKKNGYVVASNEPWSDQDFC